MAHDVFISHCTNEKPVADAVWAALALGGVTCWVAPNDTPSGETWAAAMLNGIGGARVMALVLSRHTQSSQQVRLEVERAVQRGIPIAVVRVDDVAPSADFRASLGSSHWADAGGPQFERHLGEFCAMVTALLDRAPRAAAWAQTPAATAALAPSLDAEIMDDTPDPVAAPAPPPPPPLPLPLQLVLPPAPPPPPSRQPLQDSRHAPRAGGATPASRRPPVRSHKTAWSVALCGVLVLAAALTWFLLRPGTHTNSLGMTFIEIKPGTFVMGSPGTEADRERDEAQHRVRLTGAFMMGVHQVTRGQFAAFVDATGYRTDAERQGPADGTTSYRVEGTSWRHPGFAQTDDHPVVWVSWNDAVAFAEWLSAKEKRHYRLPTEAEWEYACRAGGQGAFPWGDNAGDGKGRANLAGPGTRPTTMPGVAFPWDDGYEFTAPAGKFKANGFGLHDMSGNVSEWCADWYDEYPSSNVTDPTGPNGRPPAGAATAPTYTYTPIPAAGAVATTGPVTAVATQKSGRVFRGGAFDSGPILGRIALRAAIDPEFSSNSLGFRLCLDKD